MYDIEFSKRLKKLPPYLFVEIDSAKRKALSEGRDIIDLGVGDPDLGTPQFIIDAMNKALDDKRNHNYALDAGLPVLRKAIAKWYEKRFGVELNPDTEIHPLIGSKEGIAHLPLAVINPSDIVLVPEPCYPPYISGSIFAGARIIMMPLLEKNNFLPDLNKIKKGKLIFINYPNNPTSAVADKEFFTRLVNIAKQKEIMIASDLAYSEIYYDNQRPHSLLEIAGAKDTAVEFHSLSKTYNMTGWRIGWVCGNSKIVSAIARVKSNIDSGIFQAIQLAAVAALESDESFVDKIREVYQSRRDCLVDSLNSLGWKIEKPKATFYVWAKIPKAYKTSMDFAKVLLDAGDIIATPGVGFGAFGEGYIRMALTVEEDRLIEVINRIRDKKIL